jgi:SAM-dependent methyltransferase
MSDVNWREFWRSYRETEIRSDEDLFFEVGKTVNQRPIPEETLCLSIELIKQGLQLASKDRLLELCCGNGLTTKYLARLVEQVYAVDFVERLIQHAIKFRWAPNIHYVCADAVGYLDHLIASRLYLPSKVLLGDALGYFEPSALGDILARLKRLTGDSFILMATGIPSDELKSNFYNTPERIRRYEENQLGENNTNDGIGRWWRNEELEDIARKLELRVILRNQPPELSTCRIDAVFEVRP